MGGSKPRLQPNIYKLVYIFILFSTGERWELSIPQWGRARVCVPTWVKCPCHMRRKAWGPVQWSDVTPWLFTKGNWYAGASYWKYLWRKIKLHRNEMANWPGARLRDGPRGSESSPCRPWNATVKKKHVGQVWGLTPVIISFWEVGTGSPRVWSILSYVLSLRPAWAT